MPLSQSVGGPLRPSRWLNGEEIHAVEELDCLVRAGTAPGGTGEYRLHLLSQDGSSGQLLPPIGGGSAASPCWLFRTTASLPDLSGPMTTLVVAASFQTCLRGAAPIFSRPLT